QPPPAVDSPVDLVVIIPAHDEEQLIGTAVRSVLASVYELGDLQVVVVADNCTDGTAGLAERAGATALRHSAPGGKGAAIEFALAHLAAQTARPHAVAVI